MAELLVWPALLAYGEAAVAYAGNARRPGPLGLLATWGVRLGWLAQTALLVVQASGADGFPWNTWAGSLNLFVWLVVSAYLIWGCSPRYRLLGLGVMPLAAAFLALSYAAGGTENTQQGAAWGDVVLVLHVALILVSFAGFTVAGGLAALELWQERELKSHPAGLLRLRLPSLLALDRLTVTTVGVSLAALTAGIIPGLARLPDRGVDVLIAGTVVLWALGASVLYLRVRAGRRELAAVLALGGVGAVIVLQLGLLFAHVA
ncbi:MAG TPA: cytochrome c biogenesis protein CcsA [Gaiellaceae bacterium]|nr:cytochrome c biogenesis protein CcsA [Gaiellaceae bacterium]